MGPPFPGRLGDQELGFGFYFPLTAGDNNTLLGDPSRTGEDRVQHGLREPAEGPTGSFDRLTPA